MTKLKSIRKYIRRQKIEIKEGGLRIIKRKLATIFIKLSNYIPLIYGVKLIILIVGYVANTLLNKHKLKYLKEFGVKLQEIIKQKENYQTNKISSAIIEADDLVNKLDLENAVSIYHNALKINRSSSEIYMKIALAYYWQGKYRKAVESHETSAKLQQENAINQGLNLFGVRVISNKLWGFYIGHLGILDVLVKLRLLDLLSSEKRIIYIRLDLVSNLCYLNYWRKYFEIIILDKVHYENIESVFLPISENMNAIKLKTRFASTYSAHNIAEIAWIAENRPPLLKLTETDKNNGHKILDQLGIPKGSWYVGLHVREGGEWSNTSGPDSDILSYLKAIKKITSQGGWVIRMGHPGMKPLPPLQNVIDYANTKYKTDWMDVFIWATCKFFIGTSSGPLCIPATFGKPVLLTNAIQIGISPYFKNSFMVPKLVWSSAKKRLLTFKEMLDGPTGWTTAKTLKGIDYTFVDNTPDELEMAVLEMMEMFDLSNKKFSSLSDKQIILNKLINEYGDTGKLKISDSFLCKHCDLLPQDYLGK